MPCTRAEARDALVALVNDAACGVSPEPLLVLWDDNEADVPREAIPWARTTIAHLTGQDAGLAGSSGSRRYERVGVITVQIFTPSGDGLSLSDDLVAIIQGALQGVSTPEGVWIRSVTANEVGSDGPWFQVNVTGTFLYDELA